MRRFRPRWRRALEESGQVVVLVALLMSGMLLSVGLAIDAGQLYMERRSLQVAADAAAWAGAVDLHRGRSTLQAYDSAILDAARNGFEDGEFVTVTVNIPPASGPFAGRANYVEVIITELVPTTFLPGASDGRTAVSARAVAGPTPAVGGHAVMTLAGSGDGTFKITGNANLTTSGSGVFVNSSGGQASQLTGQGDLITPYTDVVGGAHTQGAQAVYSPPASTGVPTQGDPLAAYLYPDVSGMPTYENTNITGSATLAPGVYAGGIKIDGSGTVRFRAGTYVLKGGGMQVTGSATLKMHEDDADDGITLFNTHTNYPGDPGTCGSITFAGTANIQLQAPTSGPYAGMFIFQDRRCTTEIVITGTAGVTTLIGTIYSAGGTVKLSGTGSGSLGLQTQVISNKVEVTGNADITLNYDPSRTARPLLPGLVE